MGPDAELKYPDAYSPIVDFPIITAPAFFKRVTTVASLCGTKSWNTADPKVVNDVTRLHLIFDEHWNAVESCLQAADDRDRASSRSASCRAFALTVCTALSFGPSLS